MGKEKTSSQSVDFREPRARNINLDPPPYIQSRGRSARQEEKQKSDTSVVVLKPAWDTPSAICHCDGYDCRFCGDLIEMGRKLAKVGDKLAQEKMPPSKSVVGKDPKTESSATESKAPIKESEALKAAKEVTKVSKDVADAASVAGGSGARASDIRNKFERGESFLEGDKNKEIKKRKTKIKYAGVGSVKEQFMKEAEKAVNGTPTDGQPRKMKEITPPREGVAAGVLESQPAARPEGVVGATVGEQTVTDYIGIGKKTKDVRERFKRLEKTGSMIKIKPFNKSQGGIYENEPDKLLDIARQEKEDAPHLVVTTSAAERKNAFLKKATEESKIKRFDAKAELQELASKEKNVVYESTPTARSDDIVAADNAAVDDYMNLSGAKSIREKFMDPSKLQREVKKTVSEIINYSDPRKNKGEDQ
ncbi:unnamed protein product [Hymenolepis diminuta]|uniref:Uncharacterized protein n=1 Tax=Hymenolepis diminuta TaxID=6216 RepID=A0A564YNT1_HYMDI|nr:unnamed protein product [Hymenolepis diminuta]